MATRLAILSDTHLREPGRLPERVREEIAAAELAIHAGDTSALSVVRELEAIGTPLVAVAGNVEEAAVRDVLPEQAETTIGGVRIAVVHDSGAAAGRLDRLRRRFPGAGAVIFGHSHMPLLEASEEGASAGRGFQIFNPGSPTQRRRAPYHTMGRALVADGTISFELIRLD